MVCIVGSQLVLHYFEICGALGKWSLTDRSWSLGVGLVGLYWS